MMNKTHTFVAVLFITFLSCDSDPTLKVEYNYEISKDFLSSKNYDLIKWNELDSIFKSSVYDFNSIRADLNQDDIDKVDIIQNNYRNLSNEFYKNYFFSQLEKLKLLLSSIDINDEVNLEKFKEALKDTSENFYNLNRKLSPELREEITQKLGSLYAESIEASTNYFNEELKINIEDFSNQFKSTLEEIFN